MDWHNRFVLLLSFCNSSTVLLRHIPTWLLSGSGILSRISHIFPPVYVFVHLIDAFSPILFPGIFSCSPVLWDCPPMLYLLLDVFCFLKNRLPHFCQDSLPASVSSATPFSSCCNCCC